MRYTVETRFTDTELLVVFALDFLCIEAPLRCQNGEKPVHIPIDLSFFENFSTQYFDSAAQVVKIRSSTRPHQGIEDLRLKLIKWSIHPVLSPRSDDIGFIVQVIKQFDERIIRYLLVRAANNNDFSAASFYSCFKTSGLCGSCAEFKSTHSIVADQELIQFISQKSTYAITNDQNFKGFLSVREHVMEILNKLDRSFMHLL